MRLTLEQRKKETADVESFIWKPEEPVTWKAGQFFHYVLHHEPTDDRGSDRWFTVSSAPSEKKPMITTRNAGEKGSSFKRTLFSLKEGDIIEISDLDGDFVIEDLDKEYVFLAGGIGVTPFRSILKELDHTDKKIKALLVYANRDRDIVYKDELEDFASRNKNLKIEYVFSPERIDENKIRQLVPNLKEPVFYVSGPEKMVENLISMLKSLGVVEPHIKGDWFPGYPEK